MRYSDRYPIIVTRHVEACREFYVRHLGFKVGFAASWFTWLTTPDGSATIAFMTPDHPSSPPGADEFSGRGVCFELQVEDAAAAYAEVTRTGLVVDYPLTDEPFGQRRFGFSDPAGVWVDVVEQIAPAAGFWDRYMVPEMDDLPTPSSAR